MSNTSPLIALSHLGDLHLLQRILGCGILIPPAVAREFSEPLPEWITIQQFHLPIGPQILRVSLGAGESEALALALEINADLVLLDDKAARRLAVVLHIPILGTLGLLLKAKTAGLIPAIRPKLEALRALPFHVSSRLYDAVLSEAGEKQ